MARCKKERGMSCIVVGKKIKHIGSKEVVKMKNEFDWSIIPMIFLPIFAFAMFMSVFLLISFQQQSSRYYTDMFVEEQGEVPLSFFSLNRRGGIIWSDIARDSFEEWKHENDIASRVRLDLLNSRARGVFNFGMFENMFDDE